MAAEQLAALLAGQDKLKQAHQRLAGAENERRSLAERLEAAQTQAHELRRGQQAQHDQLQRQQELGAELEVQKAALESQLRIAKWSQETADQMGSGGGGSGGGDSEELNKQLLNTQREKAELRGKVEALAEKVRHLENERNGGGGGGISKFGGHVQFDRSEKSLYGGDYDSNRMESEAAMTTPSGGGGGRSGGAFNCGLDHSMIEQENRDLRMRVRRLETQIAEKESELARAKAKLFDVPKCGGGGGGGGGSGADADRYRAAQLQAERLLDAREQSHRQQVMRLENQVPFGVYINNTPYDNTSQYINHVSTHTDLDVARAARPGGQAPPDVHSAHHSGRPRHASVAPDAGRLAAPRGTGSAGRWAAGERDQTVSGGQRQYGV